MWLIEEKVQLRTKYDRGVVKEEINKLLAGTCCTLPNNKYTIRFVENGAYVNGVFTETKCGPNRTYNRNNAWELCICISPKSSKSDVIKGQFAVQMAKKIGKISPAHDENDFQTTCDSINACLEQMEYQLIIVLVEKNWLLHYGNNGRINYTTIINNKEEKNIGCFVLYEP